MVLATASREPVVHNEWIAAGAHVCAVGACRPDQREMDTGARSRGRLFVDSRAGALAEAGDIVLPIKEGAFAEAAYRGRTRRSRSRESCPRTSPAEVTVFKSLGMAVEDIAAAHLAYVKAAERGLGRGSCFSTTYPSAAPPSVSFIISEIFLRASGDILRRRRFRPSPTGFAWSCRGARRAA